METTLTNGMRLLEVLCLSDRKRGITELATECALHKSNVYRLLQTLIALGYVDQDEGTSKYGTTLRIWEFGAMVGDRIDVRAISRRHLEKLAFDTNETVHLSVLSGLEVIYIDKVDSPQPLRSYSRVGGRAPAHSVATGKALLAFADKDTMNLLSKMDFECYTYKTIATLAAFLKEIKKIKKCGYALNLGEWRDGVNGLAVPVFDHTKHAVAAVGITLPPVTPSKKLIMRLVECSKAISIELGHKFDLSA